MKKGLVTAFVIASVLAFNACKKEEGPVGPTGATGATGAPGTPGATGPVGPAGAAGAAGTNGKDGATIRANAGAPANTLGNNGDFYFDTTAKVLYGPKADGEWPADGVSLAGPQGKRAAASVIAGATLPADLEEGDFWFNTTNSTLYGPYDEDGNASNQLPLGKGGSKTYVYVAGFQNVTEVANARLNSQKFNETWGPYEIISSYVVTANDMLRINNHAGWADNREMIFETVPGSGVFDAVPTGAGDLGAAPFIVGAKFRYTTNFDKPTYEFTLTQDDIDRLTVNAGAAFGYLTYAKANPATVALGRTLEFARTKQVTRVTDTDNFSTNYTATTTIDFHTIAPELEQEKLNGAYVFIGYNYFNGNASAGILGAGAQNNTHLQYVGVGGAKGMHNISDYINQYVKPGVAYGGGYTSVATNFDGNAFTVQHPNQVAAGNFGTQPINFAWNNVATPTITPGTNNVNIRNGRLHMTWAIASGVNYGAAVATAVGPVTLTNPAGVLNVVSNGVWETRPFETIYYSGAQLTSGNTPALGIANGVAADMVVAIGTRAWEKDVQPVVGLTSAINAAQRFGGWSAAQISAHKLVRVIINVVPAEVVAKAKAAGIDVNNPEALINFANSLQLQ